MYYISYFGYKHNYLNCGHLPRNNEELIKFADIISFYWNIRILIIIRYEQLLERTIFNKVQGEINTKINYTKILLMSNHLWNKLCFICGLKEDLRRARWECTWTSVKSIGDSFNNMACRTMNNPIRACLCMIHFSIFVVKYPISIVKCKAILSIKLGYFKESFHFQM